MKRNLTFTFGLIAGIFGGPSYFCASQASLQDALAQSANPRLIESGGEANSPKNLYASQAEQMGHWFQADKGVSSTLEQNPATKPPVTTPPLVEAVYRYALLNGNNPEARLNPPNPRPQLKRNADYVASIFVRNDHSDFVRWRVLFLGRFDGSVQWSFAQRQIVFSGHADPLNSGVEDCGDGWVRLWVRATTGKEEAAYEAPVLSLEPSDRPSAFVAGAAFEEGRTPSKSCRGISPDSINIDHWVQVALGVVATVENAVLIPPPAANREGVVQRYMVQQGNNPEARLNPMYAVLPLDRKTEYTASVFVKADRAEQIRWRLLFLGQFDGSRTWIAAAKGSPSGPANVINSKIADCGGGWLWLAVSGVTGETIARYESPVLSLDPEGTPSAYFYGAMITRGKIVPPLACKLMPNL